MRDIHIELYMRELLKLLSLNFMSSGKGIPLRMLHDKIVSYLRSLDFLGMTTDNFAAVLCSLVESCLSEELIKVWQRNYSLQIGVLSGEAAAMPSIKDRFNKLILFLQNEVQNDVRNSLVSDRLGLEYPVNS